MLGQLGIQPAQFSARYRDAKGEWRDCFELDRYHTEVLVTGYGVMRDIRRMLDELEEDALRFQGTYRDKATCLMT